MAPRIGPLAPGVAFITGGARGLGNAIAVCFAKDGARGIAIVDIQDEETFTAGKKAVEDEGTKCLTIRADVTKESEVEAAVAKAVAEFGRIDYAANFAGVIGGGGLVSNMDFDIWKKTFDVNIHGVMLSMKYELRQMMKQDPVEFEAGRVAQRGSIVNAASVNSILSMPTTGAYTGTKHAVAGITKTAALEAWQYGIRVNCVSPGFLLTKLIEGAVKNMGEERWGSIIRRQGREAQFEEVGDVVVLLSNPRMSLVTGQNLPIDGGYTINELGT